MSLKQSIQRLGAATVMLVASQALGQFEINWHTVGGGGVMNSSDGQPNGFVLSGTIGQHDAQVPPVMSGGGFALTGGFWPVANVCYCLGDMNADGLRNGRDIQRFVGCVLAGGDCSCADVDQANGVTFADVTVFVSDLLAGDTCP